MNEAIKVLYGFNKLDDYKMCFINLVLPLFLLEEPLPPKKNVSKAMDKVMRGPVKAIPEGYTIWDRIVLKGPMQIGQIAEFFRKEYECDLSIISVDEHCLFMKYNPSASKRLVMTPDAALREIIKKDVTMKYLILEATISWLKDYKVSVSVPTIQYML